MELKQLSEKCKQIFCINDISELSNKLFDICINNKFEYYEKFIDLVQDLSVDWLQRVYQYYQADRKKLMQDYTPVTLARFTGKLTEYKEEKVVLDLCAGSGALTIQKWNLNKDLQFICYEYDENVIPFLLFNLAVRKIDAIVIYGDALQDEVFAVYRIFEKNVKQVENVEIKCDTCISNPPYNMKWTIPPFAQRQKRFSCCELPPDSNANYAFILTALDNVTDKVSMILPNGVLSTNNKQEVAIRKHLVEKNLIESVITCPGNMFEATSIPVCIINFNKNKQDGYIRMIDMRETFEVEQREQNGQFGGAAHEGRTYVKDINVFTNEHMQKAINSIENKSNLKGFSKAVTIQDIAEQEYLLMPSRYIDLDIEEEKHREYAYIIDDLNRVISDKNLCKLTMNETIAKSIGMYEVFEISKQSKETNKAINESLKFIGKEILKEDFISMTKNKNEIKFENNSKDKLSTIFMSIMQMWKQHVMYLNNEENRYLIELRDALLPDLISEKNKLGEGGDDF